MDELSETTREILKRDPALVRAAEEVDRNLIRLALQRSPLERLKVATAHLKALRRFERVPSQGS